MKRFSKILLKLLIGFAIVCLAITVLVISINSEKVPPMVVYTDARTVQSLTGNYRWNAFSEVRYENSFTKDSYAFKTENTLLLSPGERFTIANSLASTTRHRFSISSMYYEDSNGGITTIDTSSTATSYSDTYNIVLNAPLKDDTYIYYFKADYYEKGTVERIVSFLCSDSAERPRYWRGNGCYRPLYSLYEWY